MNYTTRMERRQQEALEKKAKQKAMKKAIIPALGATALVGSFALPVQHGTTKVSADEIPQIAPTFPTIDSFIATIAPSAEEICDANDLYASVMIAQAILESSAGNSTLAQAPYYNLFGVKGTYDGGGITFDTQEYIDGQWLSMPQTFRSYGSYWASLMDNAAVLTQTSFSDGNYHYYGAWKRNTAHYTDATTWLTGTYATDYDYADKLNELIATYDLTQYDTPSTLSADEYQEKTNVTTIDTQASLAATTGNYTVVEGDTLWDISQKFGLTLDELMAKNHLTSYEIYIGDALSV